MADRPIIFSAPMVRALLDGRKTQTRRVLKKPSWAQSEGWPEKVMDEQDLDGVLSWFASKTGCLSRLPIPQPGDRLWVRETWQAHSWATDCVTIRYRAEEQTAGFTAQIEQIPYPDGKKDALKYVAPQGPHKWRSPIHMPRWASRLTLTVTDVRVQRVQEIKGRDAIAEGVRCEGCHDVGAGDYSACRDGGCFDARITFRTLWNSIHGPNAWDANPWVVALTFDVHRRNIDQMSCEGTATA